AILRHFLAFRMEEVVRRLEHELAQLEKRIHILRGVEKIFDELDEAIKIIRSSNDKADAAQRLMHRFGLDDEQADAILEIKLYRLAKMEIEAIRKELKEKLARAREIRELLEDEEARWQVVRGELEEVAKTFGTERKTEIAGPDERLEYTAEDYIINEDFYVMVSRDGWVKRQRTYTDVASIRVRDGDEIGWIVPGSTRGTVGFFTNFGRCYTIRIADLPSTTGYGDPVQKLFDFSDKERIMGVISFDDRALPKPVPVEGDPQLFGEDGEPEKLLPFVVAITRHGQGVRFTIDGFTDVSTKNGRMFMRLDDKDEVVGVDVAAGDENICLASRMGHVLIFPIAQIPVFKGAAKGVIAMRIGSDDRVLGFALSNAAREGLEVETSRGRREIVRTTKFEVTKRGNKGKLIIRRGHLS